MRFTTRLAAKPGCKKCYGRGYIGTLVQTGQKVRCRCVRPQKVLMMEKPNPITSALWDNEAVDYDHWYDGQSGLKRENVYIRRILERLVLKPRGKVLDIGCGTGLFLDLIDMPKDRYWGLDISTEMINRAHAKHPDNVFTRWDADIDWPFKKNSFDTVVALFSLNYLKDLHQFKKRMRSVLKRAGTFFFILYTPRRFKHKDYKHSKKIEVKLYDNRQIKKMFPFTTVRPWRVGKRYIAPRQNDWLAEKIPSLACYQVVIHEWR